MQYTNNSQRARVSTEAWVRLNGYCLACESEQLSPTKTNTQARDFECPVCGHPYELKSASKPFGLKVVDGAYASMIRRVEDGSVPSFLMLRYSPIAPAIDLVAIHRSFITPEVIERRKPLSLHAKRAGWIGCNLLLGAIPPEGRISLIKECLPCPRETARAMFGSMEKIASKSLDVRSWSRSLLMCLHRLSKPRFTLAQVYAFEHELSLQYPENRNVRPKIRQQLQVLRDAGFLTFEKRGEYRLRYIAGKDGGIFYHDRHRSPMVLE